MTATINASTSSGVVITPDNSGNILLQYNGQSAPAFSAYQSSAQTISTATATKLQFQTERFDTNNNFDSSTNYRFTPTVAGYYQVNANAGTGGGLAYGYVSIYKNGSEYSRGVQGSGGAGIISYTVSDLVYLNGSTDYLEIYFYQASGGNATLAAVGYLNNFSGCLLRGA